jgi:hypothetical protein
MNAIRLTISFCLLHFCGTALFAQTPRPQPPLAKDARVLFLHHSTGECIWNGGVPAWFESHNAEHQTRYAIEERAFPKESPYGWENFPYDYWNIWVRHAGPRAYREEPTLEMLTPHYQVIVFKHCFPVSNIDEDTGRPDVAASEKRIENYRLQYAALKAKLKSFPSTRFLVWTGAAQVLSDVDAAAARRARSFFDWVRKEWDQPGDNIYVFDFYALETGGGLYLKPEYASGDAHPNEAFSRRVAPLLCRRVVDVIEGRGDTGSLTGGDLSATAVPPAVSTRPTPAPTTRAPAAAPVPAPGTKDWVFDNAEDASRRQALWTDAARYIEDGRQHAIRIDFAAADSEDWGEYGVHRVAFTKAPAANTDVAPYRYLSLRVKADREMEVVLKLNTLPKPEGDRYQPHFGFSGYLHTTGTGWQTVVLDLTRLELAVEGEGAYEAAGSPPLPQQLSTISFAIPDRHAGAEFLVDDLVFYRDLPASLKSLVQEP